MTTANQKIRDLLQRQLRPSLFGIWCLMLTGVYWVSGPDRSAGIRSLAILACVSAACLSLLPRRISTTAINHPWRIGVIVFALWGPIFLDWYGGLTIPGIHLYIERLLVFFLSTALFLIVAPLPNIGFTFRLNCYDFKMAGLALLVFSAVAIPLGLSLGFIRWHTPDVSGFLLVERAFNKFTFTAVPEELLFRGAVLNVLAHNWRWPQMKSVGPLLIASLIFGVEHINTDPVPNLPYMLMATIAGIAYGWVYQKTRKITAAALTHGAVDWIWVTYF